MFKKKYLLFLLILIVVILLIIFWPVQKVISPQPGHLSTDEIIGQEISLVRVGMFHKKTNFGFVNVPFLKQKENLKFLNVVVDLNNDQKFAAYPVGEQTQPEWVVQNMPVRLAAGENSFAFFFPDQTVRDNLPPAGLRLRAVLTAQPLSADKWDGTVPVQAISQEVKVRVGFEDIGDLQSPASGKDGAVNFLDNDGYINFNFIPRAKAQVKIIDEFHGDVPDIDQKRNECAPTSAANSLIWLARKYKFEKKLPKQDVLIQELKKDMDWNEGIAPADFLPGKEKITKRRKLPLVNHKIGEFNGENTFEAMAKELHKGQDVEMRIQYKDARGRNIGGHWVTVVGVERLTTGAELVEIHDPLSPGPAKLQIYRLDKAVYGHRLANYPYGPAYISFAVAESYVAPPPAESVTPSTPKSPPVGPQTPPLPKEEPPASPPAWTSR